MLDPHGIKESQDELPKVFLKDAHLTDGLERDAWQRDSRSLDPKKA
jgi:hypothetical protein